MRKVFFFLSILSSISSFAQISGAILNAETKEKVPFVNVWILDKNIGTTANEFGVFTLKSTNADDVVFSAIGYERTTIRLDTIYHTIELTPSVVQLSELVIIPRKQTKEFVIGEFVKKEINHYFGCGAKPWIVAKFFAYDSLYSSTPFLKKLKFLTRSDVKNAKSNIRLYGVDENGSPGEIIYDKNIIVTSQKGKKWTEIDVSTLGIRIPESGFFIAIEWLIIPDNKYRFKYVLEGSDNTISRISYEPAFGAEQKASNENSWKYHLGKWEHVRPSFDSRNLPTKTYLTLAIQVTLTN